MLNKLLVICCLLLMPVLVYGQSPTPKWVTTMGGSGDSKCTGMSADAQNNVYVTGYFRGTIDFDPSAGVTNLSSNGDADIYIAKYSADGALIWARAAGGYALDQVNSLAVDAQGNSTVIGQYQSSSFDANPGAGINTINNSGGDDIFIIHLDNNGSFGWAKSLGGADADRGEDVVTDNQGNIITASIYQSTFTIGGKTLSAAGQFNSLIVKYDLSGNIIWNFSLGQGSYNEARGINVDKSDNILISGAATGPVNFNPMGSALNINSTGAYLAKYNAAGILAWERNISANLIFGGSEVCVDGNDNVYIGGAYNYSVSFEGGGNLSATGYQDVFIAQYSPSGQFGWARDLGGSNSSIYSYRMGASSDNNVYITGYFNGNIDFNPDPTVTSSLRDHGQRDLFLAKYTQSGSYLYAFNLGNSNCSSTLGIEMDVDGNNNLLLAGSFCQTVNFSPENCVSSIYTAKNYDSDSFLAKYVQSTPANLQITAFSVPRQVAPTLIDQVNHKITISLELGEDVTALIPIVSTSGGTLNPASGTARDFSSSVMYTLTSGCDAVTYTTEIKYIITHNTTLLGTCSNESRVVAGDDLSFIPDSYLWQQQKGTDWVTASGTANEKDFSSISYSNDGETIIYYNIRRQVTENGNITYDSYYTLGVNPSTSNNVISANIMQYCQGSADPINLTGNQPNGYTSKVQYQWQRSTDKNAWQNIADANKQSLSYTASLTATTYFRRVTTKGDCTAYSNIIQIDYSTNVTTAQAGINQNLCNQGQANLAANVPAAGETGTWTIISPANYNPFDENNIHNPAARITNLPIGNTVVLQWTIVKNACLQQSTSRVTITNNDAPKITDFVLTQQTGPAIINQTVHTITITVVPGTDVSSLTPNIIINMGALSPASGSAQNFTSPINYTLTSDCGIVKYTVTVTKLTAAALTVCQNETPMLKGDAASAAGSYQWQVMQSGGWANVSSNGNQEDYTAVYPDARSPDTKTYTFRRVIMQPGNTTYGSFYQITYLPLISNNIISASKNTVCALDLSIVQFNGTVGSGGAAGSRAYQWQLSNDGITWSAISGAVQQNYQYTPTLKQDIYIRRKISSGNCEDYSTAFKLAYTPLVTTADAGKQQLLCNQAQVTLQANLPASGETGTWSVVGPAGYNPFNTGNIHNPKVTITNIPPDVDVQLMWTISTDNCNQSSQKTVLLRNNSLPVINMGNTQAINPGEQIALAAKVSGGNNTYLWSPAEGLNNRYILNPIASPLQTTTYSLIITTAQGCTITGAVTVQVNNKILVPNTFTPNGDGINDYWNIKDLNQYISSQIWIYNRWGEPLYYSRGYAKPWDAIYQGKPLPAGVYYYIITVDELKLRTSGSISVIY